MRTRGSQGFFSSPSQIVKTAIVKWQSGALPRDIAYTAASTLLGFLLGTVVGSIVGLLFWFSKPVALVAEPWLIVRRRRLWFWLWRSRRSHRCRFRS